MTNSKPVEFTMSVVDELEGESLDSAHHSAIHEAFGCLLRALLASEGLYSGGMRVELAGRTGHLDYYTG